MFDRFTDRARKVMALGRNAAKQHGQNYIGTEHILLGLMEEGSGVAANALRNLGATKPKIEDAIIQINHDGPSYSISMGQLPFTPRTKKVLEISSESATALKHNYIGTEHLLLGLVREGGGAAVDALAALDLSTAKIEAEVLELVGAHLEAIEESQKNSDESLKVVSASEFFLAANAFFDRYQEFTGSTALYPGSGAGGFDAMTYVALKMNGEAGEFAEKLGKRIRKGKSIGAITRDAMTEEFRLELAKELGDVLWYVSQASTELGFTLSEIAQINIDKLTSRKQRGVIDGEGDNR